MYTLEEPEPPALNSEEEERGDTVEGSSQAMSQDVFKTLPQPSQSLQASTVEPSERTWTSDKCVPAFFLTIFQFRRRASSSPKLIRHMYRPSIVLLVREEVVVQQTDSVGSCFSFPLDQAEKGGMQSSLFVYIEMFLVSS